MKANSNYRVHFSVLLFALVGFLAGCSTGEAPDFRAAIANPDRPQTERELDAARKPAEVLAFYGVKPGDKVADLWAGRGYYTAILSQVVGANGVVYTANPTARDEINQRWKSPQTSPMSKMTDGAFDKLALPQDGTLDFVLIHLNYHDVAPEVRVRDEQKDSRCLETRRHLRRGRSFGEGWQGNEAIKTLHRIDKVASDQGSDRRRLHACQGRKHAAQAGRYAGFQRQ